MIPFKEYNRLDERFINLLPGDEAEKAKHAPEVHSMLQKAYAKIGGIHGSGFKDHEDMVKNIPMWKLYKHEGKIKAVKLYKDKEGRKSVASATDGSPEGKAGLGHMMKDDMTQHRSYGEISGSALKLMKKNTPDFHKHVVPIDRVKELTKGDEIRKPPADDPELISHPELTKHFYQRKIGGEWHTKLMTGNTGNKITKR